MLLKHTLRFSQSAIHTYLTCLWGSAALDCSQPGSPMHLGLTLHLPSSFWDQRDPDISSHGKGECNCSAEM